MGDVQADGKCVSFSTTSESSVSPGAGALWLLEALQLPQGNVMTGRTVPWACWQGAHQSLCSCRGAGWFHSADSVAYLQVSWPHAPMASPSLCLLVAYLEEAAKASTGPCVRTTSFSR